MSYYRQGPGRPAGPGIRIGVPGLTPMVRNIMIACGVVWILQVVLSNVWGINLALYLGVSAQKFFFRGFLFQPLTYMFLHSPESLFHLLLNMLILWMFGGELERYWGGVPFLRYYLVTGVGAAAFALVAAFLPGGNPAIPTIGASGAIFGIIVAYGMIFGERTVLFMMLFPMKARTMAIILFGINLFYTITQPGNGVSHVAHVGGAVVGFLYLKRAWRVGDLYRELRWKIRRRRFKVMSSDKDDPDRWVN